jgi:hypothetical protein
MKKISLLAFLIIVFLNSVNCQITKANWLVGGNGSFSSIKEYDNLNNNTSTAKYVLISTNLGYFFLDKLAAGIRLRFSYQKNTFSGATDANSYSEFGVGSFVRYYYLKKENLINIFSEISYQYTIAKTSSNATKANRNSFAFLAGPVIFFNNNISLEFPIGYSITKNQPSNYKTNSLQFGVGLQIHLEKN